MPDEQINLEVNLTAEAKLDKALGQLEEMSTSMLAIGKQMSGTAKQTTQLVKALNGINTRKVDQAARATTELAKAQERATRPVANRWVDLNTNPHQADLKTLTQLERQHRTIAQLNQKNGRDWLVQLEKIEAQYGQVAAQAIKAAQATGTGAGSARDVASRMGVQPVSGMVGFGAAAGFVQQMEQRNRLTEAALEPQRRLVAQLQSEEEATNRLTNARYAMFAAGASVIAGSYALGAAMLATVRAAMEYETALAQISRTSEITGARLQNFAGELRDTAATIPLAFQDIAQIATLGGQLNVPTDRLADFTRTVSQFGMTTDVTADTAAEAFGRLDALLPDVRGNYDALGSSILNVGINSVATESDIIEVSTQLAAVGAQAQFASHEVIGYAAAMRSIGIRPELARGGLTRVFGVISDAIANGGQQLEQFGELSGRSAQQFAADWRGGDAAYVFQDLLRGMENARAGGADLYQTMKQLGITNSRDLQVVSVMSQNYDILAESLGYAREGFEDGTQLQEAFGVQAATLESRLQMLANSLQALFAVAAEPSLAVFAAPVTAFTELVKVVTDLIDQSPALKAVLGVVGGFATVGAGVGIAAGAFTLFVAAVIAGRTALRVVRTEMEVMKLEMMEQSAATGTNTSATIANSAAKTRAAVAESGLMRAIMGVTNAERAATAARTSAAAAAGLQVSSTQALSRVLFGGGENGTRFGRAMSLGASVLMGPWALGITGAVVGLELLNMWMKSTQATAAQWTEEFSEGAQAADLFRLASQGFDGSFGSFDFYTQMDDLRANLDYLASQSRAGIFSAFTADLRHFDASLGAAARQLGSIEQGMVSLGSSEATRTAFVNFANSLNLSRTEVSYMLDIMGDLNNIISDGEPKAVLLSSIMAEMGETSNSAANGAANAAESLYYLDAAAGEATESVATIADTLANEFAGANVVAALGNAMRQFATGLIEGGMTFNAITEAGATNVANFQGLVEQAIAAGNMQGLSAAQSVNQLFAVLKANGLDVMAILNALRATGVQSIGGVGFDQLRASARSTQGTTTNFGDYMRSTFSRSMDRARAAINRTSRSLGGGGGGGGGKRGLGGSAASAAQEVRTLVDYTSDLRKVMSRAFDIRFGSASAMDKITSGWIDIAEKSADARESIAEATRAIAKSQASLGDLAADRSIQNYFLSIAEAYGDGLRAAKIRAEIADIDSKIADEQADVAKSQKDRAEAQEQLGMSLVGNSKAAIENRKTVLDMVDSYQDYLLALASSGASQAELQSKAAELRRQFMEQGVAMGYSREELNMYGAAFQDFSTIIARVPYEVTVTMNGDPALQALAEFEAEAERRGAAAGGGIGGAIGSGIAGALGGIDWDELFPDPEDFFNDETPKWLKEPAINRGDTTVRPGDIEIYDPEPSEFQGTGGDFERSFDYGRDPAPFMETYGGNLGLALLAGVYNSITGGGGATEVKKGLRDTIQGGPDWTGMGLFGGLLTALGVETGFINENPQAMALRNFQNAPWGTKGSTLGRGLGTGVKLGYTGKLTPSELIKHAASGDWNRSGSGSGSKFGEGVKGGYNRSSVPSTLLGPIGRGDWYGRGSSSGDKFGYGVKVGYAKQNPGSSLAKAIRNADWYSAGYKAGSSIETGMKAGFNAKQSRVVAGSGASAVRWFREGGYTGGGGVNDIAGLVHKREYVMPAEATASIGKPALDYMRKHGAIPPTGGGVSLANGITVIAELSPTDRALIAEGNNIVLQVDGQAIARTTNNQNATLMKRGSN